MSLEWASKKLKLYLWLEKYNSIFFSLGVIARLGKMLKFLNSPVIPLFKNFFFKIPVFCLEFQTCQKSIGTLKLQNLPMFFLDFIIAANRLFVLKIREHMFFWLGQAHIFLCFLFYSLVFFSENFFFLRIWIKENQIHMCFLKI